MKSSRGNFAASFVGNLEEQLSPPRSGGLLLTLHLWQRLLDKGLRQFGEVYYLGQLPLGPDGEWSECLWGIYAGMEIAFYFSTDSRDLIGIEVFPTEEADPCLLMLTDYGDLTGSRLPLHWHVWHGDRKFAELRIEGWEFDATTAGAKN